MIELHTWLPQILSYCEFTLSDEELERAWIHGDFSSTSITDFDELYEQVFDDLDADNFASTLSRQLDNVLLSDAIKTFLTSLQEADTARSEDPLLLNTSELIRSPAWQAVRNAASGVLAATQAG